MRRTEEEFEGRPSERIYLAAGPGEARRVEACLDAVPADYFVRGRLTKGITQENGPT